MFSKVKTDMEGKVVTYKAKLGEKVINKVNLLTMMKLVHQLLSIQIFLAIATHYENELWQMDVKTAFLNGNLIKEVYRTQP